MAIPFLDLSVQSSRIQSAVEPKIFALLASGQYVRGPAVIACVRELAQLVGSSSAFTVSNGTIALVMALQAIEMGPDMPQADVKKAILAVQEVVQ